MERRINTAPIATQKSRRRDQWRGLTSMRAGLIYPIAFFPMLREDAARGRVTAQIRMDEAVRTIINPIRVVMQAHLIPKTALPRFDGSLETLNRSYMKQTLPGGGASPAWYLQDTTISSGGVALDDDKGHAFYDALGVHYKSSTPMNSDLIESYFAMVNWRRRSVSKALLDLDVSANLAPAFWDSWKFDMIKPSFDAAMMEGVVPLNVAAPGYVVTEYGTSSGGTTAGLAQGQDLKLRNVGVGGAGTPNGMPHAMDADGSAAPLIVDLRDNAFDISLANIRMATQSMQFAKLRERYQGIPDEYLVEMLMQGIRVPPEDFREPILLGRAQGVIGQVERFATDGASLDVSVTNGLAQLSLPINTPAINPGGMILVTMEIVPEQLYERVHDEAVAVLDQAKLPDYLRDYLDPQKVEVVENRYADEFHSTPAGIFGYAPLNFQWQRSFARVGGRFKRPVPDAFVEDRQRIWAVEKANPALSADFYLCPKPFPHTPFADQNADPFEVVVVGEVQMTGLTVFGAGFEEDGDHYDKILAQVDEGRLTSQAVTMKDADGPGPEEKEVAEDETA